MKRNRRISRAALDRLTALRNNFFRASATQKVALARLQLVGAELDRQLLDHVVDLGGNAGDDLNDEGELQRRQPTASTLQ